MDTPANRVPLVVIGGSAGALTPLKTIIGDLPTGLGAAVCVVIHLPDDSPSELAMLLARAGPLRAEFAQDGATLELGSVSVAPPGNHLLVEDGRMRLSPGARENGSRPAIDPLFRTAARTHGARVVSVVLSGTLDDGAAGTVAVRRAGGTTLVQAPDEAQFDGMPRNAMATGAVDEVLPAARLGARIVALVRDMERGERLPAGTRGPESGAPDSRWRLPTPAVEPSAHGADDGTPEDPDGDHPLEDPLGDSVDRGLAGPALDLVPPASPYSCPACGGVLYERKPGQLLCRLGHRYSSQALAAAQDEVIEDALWTALRTLEESASLAGRVRDRATRRDDLAMARRFAARQQGAEARAERIRSLLARGASPAASAPTATRATPVGAAAGTEERDSLEGPTRSG